MLSLSHLILILLILLLLFGAGKLPSVMADLAKGIKSFKKNLDSEDFAEIKNDAISLEKQKNTNSIKDVTVVESDNILENKLEYSFSQKDDLLDSSLSSGNELVSTKSSVKKKLE